MLLPLTSGGDGGRLAPARAGSRRRWVLGVCVAVLAFAARLVPVLHGGGLWGLGDYDDGVHYSAAAALVHGRLPYRDFLFLHPPGIVLALTPFAAVGRLLGDPTGFAAARVAWMVLGAVDALLVVAVLRRRGPVAALLGGLFYALFPPAVYGEHSTQLEGLATACTLVALLLLTGRRRPGLGPVVLAGALLGASAGVKIWGVVAVAVVVVATALTTGRRRALAVAAGGVAGATVVCLPFFLASPGAMARMVVRDQLGRPEAHVTAVVRLTQVVGLPVPGTPVPLLVAVLAAFALLTVLAWRTAEGRLPAALLVGLTGLLMLTPSWFVHYASLVAGPAALTMGAGAAQLCAQARRVSPRLGVVVAAVLGLLVAGYAAPTASARLGTPFPGRQLAVAAQAAPGCVTTDDPTTLVEMDVLGRDLDRGCPVVVDLGGYSYDHPAVPPVPRARNQGWQRYALGYLRSGSVVVVARFSAHEGFSPATAALVDRWPVLQRVGRYAVRRAEPRG